MRIKVCLLFGSFFLITHAEEMVDDSRDGIAITKWFKRQKRDTHGAVNPQDGNIQFNQRHSTVYQYNEPSYSTSVSDGAASSSQGSRGSGSMYSAYYTGRENEGASGTIRTIYGSSNRGGGVGQRQRANNRNTGIHGERRQSSQHSQSVDQTNSRRRTSHNRPDGGHSTSGTHTDPRYTDPRSTHATGGGNRRGHHQSGSRRYQTTYQTGQDPRYNPSRGGTTHGTRYIPIHSVSTNTGSGNQAYYIPRGQNRYPGAQQRPPSRFGNRCPETGISVTVNGRICVDAVAEWPFVCYRHENTSRECCDACMERKNPNRIGCEYGDKSVQCRHIKAFECYYARNEEICCETCANFERRGRSTSRDCRFGDKANNCERVRENPGLCYQPIYEQRCCETCPMVRNEQIPGCEWGDHYQSLCEPFDDQNRIRLDCYNPYIARLCCSTCERLKQRMPTNDPACEYGDHPVRFQIPQTGQILDCYSLVQQTRGQACTRTDVSTNCCFTCRGRQ